SAISRAPRSTFRPYTTLFRSGGELNTSVIWGNSNKGHDGYLGSSVMGEWCNWGADTNNSNMKNNFKNVRMYDYQTRNYRDTKLQDRKSTRLNSSHVKISYAVF